MKARWTPIKRAARRDYLAFGEVRRQIAAQSVGRLVRITQCKNPIHPRHHYPALDCPIRAKGLLLKIEATKEFADGQRYLVHVEDRELWLREGEFTEAG
ncbi:MAG: hypothetical protein U0514_02640 [Candidatus Andersenbacteria bacterium]